VEHYSEGLEVGYRWYALPPVCSTPLCARLKQHTLDPLLPLCLCG